MSLEVFEVEEDWSCACISVRKGCVFDIISIAYARFIFIGLRLCWKCLRVSWTSFGTRLGVFCQLFGTAWTYFGVSWGALECFGGSWGPSGTVLGLACGAFGVSWGLENELLWS